MGKKIIHVDMDAFFAAVEIRDNPELKGRPLIIGALPHERGVVSTCSYEARKFGVHSAMSIKTAYRLCPQGVYMHPNGAKYKEASDQIHKIWSDYTDLIEYISLDEGFLDVTGSEALFGGAPAIGHAIKRRTLAEIGLTCSVGIAYSMTAAKVASEEKKPDGFYEIPDSNAWLALMRGRKVRALYTVGGKTAERLEASGIRTIDDIINNEARIMALFGKHGHHMVALAKGMDDRTVTPYYASEAKSIGRETTFQKDSMDWDYLKDVLVLLAREVSHRIRSEGLYCRTVTLKITFGNMKAITRSKSGEAICHANAIYRVAASLLDAVEHRPVRLVGISLSNLTPERVQQLTLDSIDSVQADERRDVLEERIMKLQRKYGADIIKTAGELKAEKHVKQVQSEET